MWDVEYTDEFEQWWKTLPEDAQESIAHDVEVLQAVGPGLGRPHVDTVNGSRFSKLRTSHDGHPFRTFFAFDPRRCAILLVAGDKSGDKSGDKRFYERMIPEADRLYEEHLAELRREENNDNG